MYKERNKTIGMGRGGIFRSISFVMLFLMLAGSLAGIGSLLFKNTSVLDEAGTGGNVVTAGITGSGNSADDPYVITTKQDLIDFANPSNAATYWRANSFAKLAADIDWGGQNGGNFSMIGNATTPYQGTFDGNKHVVENVYVSSSTHAGIFAIVSGTVTIKNFGNVNGTILSTTTATTLIGIGGIVGAVAADANLYVTDCFNTGSVRLGGGNAAYKENSTGGIVGGHVGANVYVEVTRCFNTGAVSTNDDHGHAGGIYGHGAGNIYNYRKIYISECFNAGSVTKDAGAGTYHGGIVGHLGATSGTGYANTKIENTYNTGNSGGGGMGAGTGGWIGVSAITNCYNAGVVGGPGIAVDSHLGTVLNCYNDENKTTVGGRDALNRTTADMTATDTLLNSNKMAGLLTGIGTSSGVPRWVKPNHNDTVPRYPELKCFAESDWLAVREYSKASVSPRKADGSFDDPGYIVNEKPICNSNTTVEVPSIGNGT